MKSLISILALFAACLSMSTVQAAAESKYVSEAFEITMRTGPGTDRKIIALVPSGNAVEIVETGEEWSQVRLTNGKEGWVLTRYLTDATPAAIKLERLTVRHAEVAEKNKALQEKVAALSSQGRSTSSELEQTRDALDKVRTQYEALKKESADFLKFKATYEKNIKELKQARQDAADFQSERNRLASSQLVEGLLIGGGVAILFFLLGYIMKKPKRRSGLM
ncbi:MAG: TIGR04211 family SH3 domain-containing protein [Desulfatitalea sp.]|nr:TIGR04211 family SH3 domain-containing protein [Desulfatitalea sp.]NNJ99500.1 TIGR04211 family SH3 domain-containing protein [Desulfatitalea sp.]